jgi:hypothetical protein
MKESKARKWHWSLTETVALVACGLALLLKIAFPSAGIDGVWILLFIVFLSLIFRIGIKDIARFVERVKAAGLEVDFRKPEIREKLQHTQDLSQQIVEDAGKAHDPKEKEEARRTIEQELDEVFVAGLRIGGYFEKRGISSVSNVRVMTSHGGEKVLRWDEI